MKYIIFDSPLAGQFPVIFPEQIDHSVIAFSLKERYPGIKIESAGFVDLSTGVSGDIYPVSYGESHSLRLKSNPQFDQAIIDIMLKH